MTVPSHEIVQATTDDEKQQSFDIRVQVFHEEQGFPLDTEFDEWDKSAGTAHILLRLIPSLKPIGTIRGVVYSNGDYKLTRLAVLKDYREFKFGGALVQQFHAWIKEHASANGKQGTVRVFCHSQIPVRGFYSKLGYDPEGEEFDEDGEPHQKMVLHLTVQ